jgi:hypothetical protein
MALPANTARRGAGARSKARMVSPSRSRSKARPRPIVPANTTAAHATPGTASIRAAWLRTKAKENTTTITAANRPIV